MNFIILVVGLILLVKASDVLIESSSKIAKKFGISSFIIGITVVAFGTSAPELIVGILSGINQTNQLTLGNVIGSTFANMAFIIGVCSIITPLTVRDSILKKEFPLLLITEIILLIMALWNQKISRFNGIVLIVLFLFFMIYVIKNEKKSLKIQFDNQGTIDTDFDNNQLSVTIGTKNSVLAIQVILSLAGLLLGGKLIVDSSSNIASSFGLSETLIGLTVVSIATTMPELIASITAVRKNEPDIVFGNCIGSNIFNILLVLGSSAAIHPIQVNTSSIIDILLMILITLGIYLFLVFKKKTSWKTGVILLIFYITYIVIKVFNIY